MAFWDRFFRKSKPSNLEYRVAFTLYSKDGKRCSEVRELRDGRVLFVDGVWIEGTTFKDRGHAEGLYESLEAAESAAVSRTWFNTGEEAD